MLGIVIGTLFGAAGFYMLVRFVRSIAGNGEIPVLLLIAQPLCILFALGLTALVASDELAASGTTMALVLICGAVVYTLKEAKRRLREAPKNEN